MVSLKFIKNYWGIIRGDEVETVKHFELHKVFKRGSNASLSTLWSVSRLILLGSLPKSSHNLLLIAFKRLSGLLLVSSNHRMLVGEISWMDC